MIELRNWATKSGANDSSVILALLMPSPPQELGSQEPTTRVDHEYDVGGEDRFRGKPRHGVFVDAG